MRKSIKPVSAAVLAVALFIGGQGVLASDASTSLSTDAQQTPNADGTITINGFDYTKDAVDALNYLNEIRAKSGAGPLSLDPFITKAAQNHSSYIKVNNTYSHNETVGKTGFTGEQPWDRLKAVGFDTSKYGTSEVMEFSRGTATQGVKNLLDVPLHRSALITPAAVFVGFGVSSNNVTINLARNPHLKPSAVTVYPYSGQTNVPVHFSGNEIPNPLDSVGLTTSGYILTASGIDKAKSDVAVSLKDSSGSQVDIVKLRQDSGSLTSWHLIPKSDLKYSETYTATVDGKSWSFTTMADPKAKPATTPAPTPAPAQTYSSTNVGVKLNGTYIALPVKARIINESTFIPLRGVFEAMGATVKWTPAPTEVFNVLTQKYSKPDYLGSVEITKGTTRVELLVGTTRAFVNGREKTLSTPSQLIENSTMVPLRFVTEALGAKVDWDPNNWTVLIESE